MLNSSAIMTALNRDVVRELDRWRPVWPVALSAGARDKRIE
jgi:hypothetical protein